MLTGDKALPADTPASADNTRTRALALLLAVAITFGVRWLVGLGAPVA